MTKRKMKFTRAAGNVFADLGCLIRRTTLKANIVSNCTVIKTRGLYSVKALN